MAENVFRIVIIGDRLVGKSSLLRRYAKGTFEMPNTESFPPVVPEYTYEIGISDETTSEVAALLDTVADDDLEPLRSVLYTNCSVILICFAINDEQSFFNVTNKWYPEIRKHQPKIPFLLVGTKVDLKPKISTREGYELCEKIKAAGYVECSSKNGNGVKEVFTTSLKLYTSNALQNRNKNRKPCNLL
ncbi:hypothetical protein FQR65_LT08885 [Abscondita terminalis]|nr:hypothetical protein FQR65_LT08885 [Abscondita terminalis]